MARSFILGGVSATGLATGKPYLKRIIRQCKAAGTARPDGLTCQIDADGNISFDPAANHNDAVSWNAGGSEKGGELLFVQFPATTRQLSVQCLEARTVTDDTNSVNPTLKVKVMLTAPGQKVQDLDPETGLPVAGSTALMTPVDNGAFIEIGNGDTATINARTSAVFILIQNFDSGPEFYDSNPAGGALTISQRTGANATDNADYVKLLVTAVLDHEGFQGSAGVQTVIDETATSSRVIKKIWPIKSSSADGVG